jgi:hypothetical protein
LDLAMARSYLAPLLLAAVAAAQTVAVAGGPARDGNRPASNTFTLVAVTPARPAPGSVPSNGVGVGPGKPVVSNPYHVPLLQNAGSLRGVR